MELSDLKNGVLVLILIGVILGIGLTILGAMSLTIKTDTTYSGDRFNATNASCTQLTNDYITSRTAAFTNSTSGAALSSSCFIWDNTADKRGTCVTLASGSCSTGLQHRFVNVSYTYGATNTQSDAVDDTFTGIAGFTTWISIIVIVLAASIIVTLVIRSFKA